MTTSSFGRVVVATAARVGAVARNKQIRLLVACLFGGLVFAVITGPSGSITAPASGITGSLALPRVLWFVGFGLALFAARTLWNRFGTMTSARVRIGRHHLSASMSKLAIRVGLEVLLIGFGFVYVTWISPHDRWKGGLLIQIGAALLAMEVAVIAWQRVSIRAARLVAYAFVAGYGALAWMHGPVSRYLNKIDAVPHNQALGKFLMILAACLAVFELITTFTTYVRTRVARRRVRTIGSVVGIVLVAYGWLTWTTWVQWNSADPHSLAQWLSSKHLLVHDSTAGTVTMAVGAALLVCAGAWVLVDLAHTYSKPGTAPSAPQYGIRRVSSNLTTRPALIIVVLLIALEWPMHMDPASQSNIDTQIMPFVLLALGLNVVIGFAGLLDLGYVAFYAIGAYTTAYFTGALGPQPPFLLNSFWVIPLAILMAMAAGVLLGTPTLRLRGDYLAIVTLGFGEIIYIFANNLSFTGGAGGRPGTVPTFSFRLISPILHAGQDFTQVAYIPFYYLILGVVIVSMIAFSLLERSKVGRSWTAIREDEVAAASLGVNALKYKVMAFAIGASTGGLAGAFLVSQSGSLFPSTFVIQVSITVVACVIFGGMGSIPGAVVGGIVIGGLSNYLQQHNFTWYQPTDYYLYLGAMLVIMMIFRPQGIIAARRTRQEIQLTERGDGHGGNFFDPDVGSVYDWSNAAPRFPGGSLDQQGPIEPGDDVTELQGAPSFTSSSDPVLDVEHVTLRFGGVTSLSDVSLTHGRGEILAVIGPNGAGKTSLFNCLSGVYRPQLGSIRFHPASGGTKSIVGVSPYRVNRMGVARTFQTSRMFGAMTAFENVKVGVESKQRTGPIAAMLRLPKMRSQEHAADIRTLQLLQFVGLEERTNVLADSLPYGDRRRLEIARALGTSPDVLLLDEPAAGTNPAEKLELAALIRRVSTEMGVTILLIEHDMKLVMSVAERIIVLNFGQVIAEGPPAEIQRDQAVIDAYLGTTHADDEPEPTA